MASQLGFKETEQLLLNPDIEIKKLCCDQKETKILCSISNFDTSFPELKINRLEWKTEDGLELNRKLFEIDHTNTTEISLNFKSDLLKEKDFNLACYAYASTGIVRQTINIDKIKNKININKPKNNFIALTVESNQIDNKVLKLNQFYSFECVTDSMWPVTWIKTSLNNSQEFDANKSTLSFKSLNESNFGEYTCISSNYLVKSEAHLVINSNGVSVINRSFRKASSRIKLLHNHNF